MALAAWLAAPAEASESAPPERLAVGVNVLGGQIDYAFTPKLRGELRYVTGRQGTASGTIKSQVLGARGYRLFGSAPTRYYIGAEAGYVKAKRSDGAYSLSGTELGAFLGLERRLARRLWIGVDAGPYLFSLRDSGTRASDTTFDFVLNTYVLAYLF